MGQGLNGNQWLCQDDHTYPNDYTRGYYMTVDAGSETNRAFYSLEIDELCAASTLRFSAYVVNLHYKWHDENWMHYAYPRLKFVVTDPETGAELGQYDTGDITYDAALSEQYGSNTYHYSTPWLYRGFDVKLPANVTHVKFSIYNNCTSPGSGNDLALDDIEVRLVTPDVYVASPDTACRYQPYTLIDSVVNNTTFSEPFDYRWEHSMDSINWQTIAITQTHTIPSIADSDSGYYRLVIAPEGNIDNYKCCAYGEVLHLSLVDCKEPDTIRIENLIINKYSWIIICNNALLERLYPTRTPDAFLWYKNDQLVPECTIDYYTENKLLDAGTYQLRLKMGGDVVLSNIITIAASQANAPMLYPNPAPCDGEVTIQRAGDFEYSIYDQIGWMVAAPRKGHDKETLPKLEAGVYVVRVEDGENINTLKLIVK